MKSSETIRIENVYHMLAYAFEALRKGPYAKIDPDEFANAEDMFAWILGLGMSQLVKQGLFREYVDVVEDMSGLRGKIELCGTINHRIARRPMLTVDHDEFSEDNLFNRILKATVGLLVRSNRLKVSKNLIKHVLPFFAAVSDIRPKDICWDRLRYQRNNQHYLMLMNVCRLVIDRMMMSTTAGNVHVLSLDATDAKLHKLYESFVRAYFDRHFGLPTRTRHIRWDIEDGTDQTYLPEMEADIVLERGSRALIIDTKFYGAILGGRIGGKVSSANLYQLLSYVSNYQANHRGAAVSGMLLYAKTTVDDFNGAEWRIGRHEIEVRTLKLDQKFSAIKASLDGIAYKYFGDIERKD